MPNVDVISIIIGWLLGILSPVIVFRINRLYKKKDLYKGIRRELHEARKRLLLVSYLLGRGFGRLDRKYLKWLMKLRKDYEGMTQHEGIFKVIELLLDESDEVIAAFKAKHSEDRSRSIALKKEALGFMEMNLSELSVFNVDYQSLLFDVRAKINRFNQEVGHTHEMYLMTFDSSITIENHNTIKNDLIRRYAFIQTIVDDIIRKITEALNHRRY
jgi:hypothetical protein